MSLTEAEVDVVRHQLRKNNLSPQVADWLARLAAHIHDLEERLVALEEPA